MRQKKYLVTIEKIHSLLGSYVLWNWDAVKDLSLSLSLILTLAVIHLFIYVSKQQKFISHMMEEGEGSPWSLFY